MVSTTQCWKVTVGTNRNSVNMTDMAEAMSTVGSNAANTGVKINELSAIIGTSVATTKKDGNEVGTAWKSIFVNLQNTSSSKILDTLDKANAKMTEMKNGIEQMRSPIDILKDLAKTYNSLDSKDPLRSEITRNLGGKHHANILGSTLDNWSSYEKMLGDYSEGGGSALEESKKSAENLTGRLNALSNSWNKFVSTIVSSDGLKTAVNLLNGLVTGVTNLTKKFDALPTIITAIAGGLSGFKNIGIFTTIEDDLTGANKSIGMFGKSFKDLWKSIKDLKDNGIGSFFSKSTIDVDAVKSYNEAITNGVEPSKALENANKGVNKETINLMASAKGATVSEKELAVAQKSATVASKAAAVGIKALNVAMNVGAMLLITEGISLAVKGLNSMVHAVGDAKEAADGFASSYKSMHDKFNDNTSKISDLKSKYDELSNGVSKLGKNVNLTSDEYSSYKDVISQISDMMPDLAVRYNEQGEKIGFVKGQLKDLNDEYDKYKQKQAQKLITKGDDSGNTPSDAFHSYSLQETGNGLTASNRQKIMDLQDKLHPTFVSNYDKIMGTYPTSNEDKEKVLAEIQSYQDEIDTSVADVEDALNTFAQANQKYYKLSDEQQNYVSSFMSNVSDEFIQENNLGVENNARTFVNNFISNLKSNKDGIADAYKDLFSFDFDTTDMNPDEIKKKVDKMVQKIIDITGFKGGKKQLEISLGFDFVNDDANEYDKVLNKFKDLDKKGNDKNNSHNDSVQKWADDTNVTTEELEALSKAGYNASSSVDTLSSALDENRKKTNSTSNSATAIKSSFQSVWKSLKNFTDESGKTQNLQEDFLKMADAGKLTVDAFNGLDGSNELLKKTRLSAEQLTNKINKLSSSADQLSSMQSGISSLSSTLSKKKEDPSSAIDASELNGVPDEIKNCTDEYNKYIEVLGNSKSTTEECQKATDNLATAYLNNNNFLANLNDSNKDYYISQLESMGVANAEEVVMSELENKVASLAAEKEYASSTGKDLANSTYSEIAAFAQEKGYSDATTTALLQLALKKQLVNGTTLDFSGDLSNIQNYLEALGKTSAALNVLQNQKNAQANGQAYSIPSSDREKLKKYAQDDVNSALNTKIDTKVKINQVGSGGSGGGSGSSKSAKKETKETKEYIDNIEVKLGILTNAADKAKAKIEELLNFDSKKKQTVKAIESTTKAIKNEEKAIKKYDAFAKKIAKLDIKGKKGVSNKTLEKYKKLVRNGSIQKNGISVIKNEKLKTAISDYKNWYDKVKSCREEIQSLMKNVKELYETLANNPIDKASDTIDKLGTKMDLLNATIANSASVKNYKSLSNQMFSNYNSQTSAMKNAKDTAVSNVKTSTSNLIKDAKSVSKSIDTKKEIKKSGLNSKEIKSLKGYLKSRKQIPESLLKSISNSRLYNKCIKFNEEVIANKQYKIASSKATDNYNLAVQQNNESKRKIQKDVFDRIAKEYEYQLEILNTSEKAISNKIDLLEAKGQALSSRDYKTEIGYENQKIAKYKSEKKELETQLKTIAVGTDEWHEAKSAISDVDSAITDCSKNIVDMNNKITELADSIHEKMMNNIQKLSDEMDFYTSLISNKDMTDKDTGNLTNEGLFTLGAYVSNYNASFIKAEQEKKLFKDLQHHYDKKQYSFTDVEGNDRSYQSAEQMKEAIDKLYADWREQITSTNDYEQKAIDLIKEKYNSELDYMKELIDKKKEALNAEKDLYDYQKSIREKTKNITTIQKQIVALSGDNSEESMSKIQKLQQQLEESQTDLKDTQYDKMISDQSSMLDKLYSEYEDLMKDLNNDTNKLIQDAVDAVNNNQQTINNLKDILDEKFDYTSQSSDSLFSGSGNSVSGLGTIKENMNNSKNGIKNVSTDSKVENAIKNLGNEIKNSTTTSNSTKSTSSSLNVSKSVLDAVSNSVTNMVKSNVSNTLNSTSKKKDEALNYIKGHASKATKNRSKYKAVNQKIYSLTNGKVLSDKELKKLAKICGVSYNNSSKSGNLYKALKGLKISGFKTGGIGKLIKSSGEDGIAMVRNGEGFIAPKDVSTIQELIKDLPTLSKISNNLTKIDIPDYKTSLRNTQDITTIGDVKVVLEGSSVTDKDSLISALKDPKVQKTVRSVTTDMLSDKGSRLGINKFK